MATNLSLLRKLETRAVNKFCKDLGKTPTDTYRMLQKSRREKCVSRALVFKWQKRFSEGREIVDAAQLTLVKEAQDADRRLTVRVLSELAGGECWYSVQHTYKEFANEDGKIDY